MPTTTWNPSTVAPRAPLTIALGVLLFAVLTGLGAAISFPLPFTPVPVSLQTLTVLLAGAVLGPLWGPVSQLLYLAAGAAGLPVFAGGAAGPGVFLGPTGGYLAGFVAAAWITGLLVRPGASWLRSVPGLLAGHAVVFLFGVSHLMLFLGSDPGNALRLGLVPFLPGMVLKTLLAAGLLRPARLGGRFRL